MKRILLLALLAVLTVEVSAQSVDNRWNSKKPHSVSLDVGMGAILFGYVDSQITDISNIFNGEPLPECTREGNALVFNLGYKYRLDRMLSIGCNFSYAGEHNEYLVEGIDRVTSRDAVLLVTPEINVHWLNRPRYSLYSSFSLGMGFSSSANINGYAGYDRTTDGLSMQVTPLGAEFYFGDVIALVEAGLGSLGGLRVGVGYNF